MTWTKGTINLATPTHTQATLQHPKPSLYSLSTSLAQISEPIPDCGQPCSTVTRFRVFITDCTMACSSRGLKERRLITSHSTPSPARAVAASRDSWTAREWATSVTCWPGGGGVGESVRLGQSHRTREFGWLHHRCHVATK